MKQVQEFTSWTCKNGAFSCDSLGSYRNGYCGIRVSPPVTEEYWGSLPFQNPTPKYRENGRMVKLGLFNEFLREDCQSELVPVRASMGPWRDAEFLVTRDVAVDSGGRMPFLYPQVLTVRNWMQQRFI